MQVGHIRENGYEGVYFEDDEGNTLGIERADSFDDDDVQNGLDTYCITLGTGQTVYGGIDRWEVDEPGHAWLLITPEAAALLGTPDAFEIEADEAELAEVDPIVQRLIA